ncbi:nuclear transport factor 2 family protein [Chryseolinea sp. T2]|uniref:YybH family protein n=1 Tax=Chryseolinea sp. T2 TaxID=3129255 RepID=UPI00307747DA
MKYLGTSIALILAAFAISGNTQSDSINSLEEAKKAIAKSNEIYFQAFVKNDSSIFINRYAKDACIMAPNSPALCGADAPLHFFKLAYNSFGLRNGKFITTQVYGVGENYVVEEGLWQSFDARNSLFDDGKFLVLWKKTQEGWKMFRDSFSSNRGN